MQTRAATRDTRGNTFLGLATTVVYLQRVPVRTRNDALMRITDRLQRRLQLVNSWRQRISYSDTLQAGWVLMLESLLDQRETALIALLDPVLARIEQVRQEGRELTVLSLVSLFMRDTISARGM